MGQTALVNNHAPIPVLGNFDELFLEVFEGIVELGKVSPVPHLVRAIVVT
jgi:hypothetical protein